MRANSDRLSHLNSSLSIFLGGIGFGYSFYAEDGMGTLVFVGVLLDAFVQAGMGGSY